jgi:peptidoglycan/LPS O-acetylase OafA/YrhL
MAREVSLITAEPFSATAADTANPRDFLRPSAPGAGRIHGLDGLRAVAVLVVLAFHLWPTKVPGGFIGVDVFFVISGFLITTLLLKERSEKGTIRLGAFWNRRAKRLLPALLLVVFTTVAAAWLVNTDLLVGIRRQVIGALTFSTNWIEIVAGSDYFADSHRALFVTFWSLAVEEQFYLFWPLLVIGVFLKLSPAPRTVVALVLAVGSALLMAWLYNPEAATRVYYGTDTHSFGLMIGVALAFAFDGSTKLLANRWWQRLRPWMGFVAVAGILVLVMITDSELPRTYRGGLVLASVFSALAVAALPGGINIFSRLCELRPIAWVGERSYGIYLWHWPVLLIVTAISESLAESGSMPVPPWLTTLVVIVITFVFSWASFRWIEKPVQKNGFGKTWVLICTSLGTPRRVFASGAAVLVTLAVFLSASFGFISAPAKSKVQLAVEAGEREMEEKNKNLPLPGPGGTVPGGGAWPADQSLPSGDRMVAFGDSVMSGAAPAMYNKFPGIFIDAKPIRQWHDAPALVKQLIDRGAMRNVVVLNFGTNAGFTDPASEQNLRDILAMLGPKRRVVLVNTVGISKWVPATNATLLAISAEYPNTIVADWWSKAQANPGLLHSDHTHPNVEGIVVYTEVIADALAKLGPG